jgi:hypothetical protein
MWHSLDVHGGTSAGGLRSFVIVQHNVDDAVVDLPQHNVDDAVLPQFSLGVMGDGEDMPALVGDSDGEDMPELEFSDSDEEDIHAPPGPAAAAGPGRSF